MNLIFWSREHQSGTTVHMRAVTGMLRVTAPDMQIITGRFLHNQSQMLAICDCGIGTGGRKRHLLWHADLVVVNLRRNKACVDKFFMEDFHIAQNMMFLLSGYEDEIDASYLERVYRVSSEQIVEIPYCNEFCQAMSKDLCEHFLQTQLYAPTDTINDRFVRSVQMASDRILRRLLYELCDD